MQTILGRHYCRSCSQRVTAIAGGGATPRFPPSRGAESAAAQEPRGPRVSGPVSLTLYLLGVIVLLLGTQVALGAVLNAILFLATGSGGISRNANPLEVIPIPIWTVLFGVFGWLSFLLVTFFTAWAARFLEGKSLRDLGFYWPRTVWRDTAAALLLGAALFVSVVGLGVVLGWYRVSLNADLGQAVQTALIALAVAFPLAALEELATRGYAFQVLSRTLPGSGTARNIGAVVLSSLVFAFLHAMNPGFVQNPLAWIGLLLAGVYFASTYLITGNLWLAMVLHAWWNVLEGPIFGLPVSGMELPTFVIHTEATGPALWTGGDFGPEAGLLLILMLLLHLAALWALKPVLRPRPHTNTPANSEVVSADSGPVQA